MPASPESQQFAERIGPRHQYVPLTRMRLEDREVVKRSAGTPKGDATPASVGILQDEPTDLHITRGRFGWRRASWRAAWCTGEAAMHPCGLTHRWACGVCAAAGSVSRVIHRACPEIPMVLTAMGPQASAARAASGLRLRAALQACHSPRRVVAPGWRSAAPFAHTPARTADERSDRQSCNRRLCLAPTFL